MRNEIFEEANSVYGAKEEVKIESDPFKYLTERQRELRSEE